MLVWAWSSDEEWGESIPLAWMLPLSDHLHQLAFLNYHIDSTPIAN